MDPNTLAAIAGMAAATYLCRAGGYALFRAIRVPEAARVALGYVPGALFVAYAVPVMIAGGPGEWAGGAATIVLMRATGNVSAAVLGGTAAAWAVWSFQRGTVW